MLLARTGLLEAKECDPGLEEAIKSIIHAAPRTDVRELQQVRQLLVEKYGKDFALVAVENKDGKVSEKVLKKLRVEPPAQELVTLYLQEIARTYGVAWPKEDPLELGTNYDSDEGSNDGHAIKDLEEPLTTDELSRATPPRDLGPKSPVSVAPPSPSVDNLKPTLKISGSPEFKSTTKMTGTMKKVENEAGSVPKSRGLPTKRDTIGGKIPEVDELEKRFAALKR